MFKRSIILIGMPGSGKSTIGKALAAACDMDFIDTDDVLTKELGMSLQVYIDKHGRDDFAGREEEFLTRFEVTGSPCIVSTGGSAVLYPKAMEHLKQIGTVVFLDCDLPLLRKRLWNFESRGIVLGSEQEKDEAILDLYKTREPLYYKYCDVRIAQGSKSRKTVVNQIIKGVRGYEAGT